MNCIVLFK